MQSDTPLAAPDAPAAPAGLSAGRPPLLQCKGLFKSFGAVQALVDVDFEIAEGQVTGLVGENGAGKSTLAKVIAGVHQPDSGTILLGGRTVRLGGADQAHAHRIVTAHQDINLVETMTVEENLLLNNEPTFRFGVIRRHDMHATVSRLLQEYEIDVDPKAIVGELPNDLKKMVQIVKAVSLDPKILILDEPTSSLTDSEVRVALRLIRKLASDGVGLVLISHYLSEIFEVCDDLTIMRDGKVVASGPIGETTLPQVVATMVGRQVETIRRKSQVSEAAGAEPLMKVEDLSVPGHLRSINFTLQRGEVIGVTGLTGSGLDELAKAIFGAGGGNVTGRVVIEGKPVPLRDPTRSLAAGLALLTNDRLREGILPDFTLVENICLPVLDRFAGFASVLDRSAMVATAKRNMERLHVRAPGPFAQARQLSGGNQQKVLFAKWLETNPKVFIMDEPTIGIDVGSKEEIRAIIDEIATAGVGIVLITTELEELVTLCDRVLVMFRGEIVGALNGQEIERETILHASACGEIQRTSS
ncbi:sugar ABC transporter ATP-binding protein [Bauldia litoralis]|uniref:sugar ABC transporter ATP-binding protein n=1 Tax=Bauldia litoralis TaxID=665467 RepID=UPI003262FB5F